MHKTVLVNFCYSILLKLEVPHIASRNIVLKIFLKRELGIVCAKRVSTIRDPDRNVYRAEYGKSEIQGNVQLSNFLKLFFF